MGDKLTKIIGGHAMAIRDFNKTKKNHGGKYAKLYDHCKLRLSLFVLILCLFFVRIAITMKEFGENDNGGKDSMCWHNRQKDWYNAERRFIFASPNSQVKNKWISVISNR